MTWLVGWLVERLCLSTTNVGERCEKEPPGRGGGRGEREKGSEREWEY